MYETLWTNDFGRYLVATRDIPAKKLILRENALLHAPADDVTDSVSGKKLMCLVCCCLFEQTESICTACGWCICSDDCGKKKCHEEECLVFVKNKATYPPPHGWPILNKTILVHRCLLMKINNRRVWTDFLCKLQHHSETRRQKFGCSSGDNMIIENIQYFYRLSECPFTEEEIRIVSGVINVNAFSAEKYGDITKECRTAKCLFEKASIFAHSCSPNCTWNVRIDGCESHKNEKTIQDDWPNIQIEVFSAVPIKKGEMLTIFYSTSYALYGTLKRIVYMEEIGHFLCKCARCSDRTELGTFMSGVKCSYCEKGYFLPEEPTKTESRWICLNSLCRGTTNVNQIVYKICRIEDEVDEIRDLKLRPEDELSKLQTLFWKYSGVFLHKNHYVLQEISTRILQLLINNEKNLLSENEGATENNSSNLEVLMLHCQYLLDVAHILLPAMIKYTDTLETFLVTAERIWKKYNVLE